MQAQTSSKAAAAHGRGAGMEGAREALFAHLKGRAAGYANDDAIAHLLTGWALGRGMLPADLGLGCAAFEALIEAHFPKLQWQPPHDPRPRADDLERALEHEDLVKLLHEHADRSVAGSLAMTRIVATGCLGGDHLWQDMGLPSRRELSALIQLNFPRLAAENDKDMRWKKFFYRRLCEMEGLVACRSPSCEACCDYEECFATGE